jgi:predicted nucleic acid-binding protein
MFPVSDSLCHTGCWRGLWQRGLTELNAESGGRCRRGIRTDPHSKRKCAPWGLRPLRIGAIGRTGSSYAGLAGSADFAHVWVFERVLFLDASALVKLYVEEEGTRVIRGILNRFGGSLFVTDLVALEVLTSIRIALRKESSETYSTALAQFWTDFPHLYNVVDVDLSARQLAFDLTTDHRDARARSMDVLHLATALRLQTGSGRFGVTMVTSDHDLADLAAKCGLRTFDPSREPLAALPRVPRR